MKYYKTRKGRKKIIVFKNFFSAPLWSKISLLSSRYWFKAKYYCQSQLKYKLIITSLDKNWCDKDGVMLHACFQLLVDFFEKEQAESMNVFEGDDFILKDLYTWWTQKRAERDDPFADKWFNGVEAPKHSFMSSLERYKSNLSAIIKQDKAYFQVLEECAERERCYEQEDQDKLLQLISLRNRLWT